MPSILASPGVICSQSNLMAGGRGAGGVGGWGTKPSLNYAAAARTGRRFNGLPPERDGKAVHDASHAAHMRAQSLGRGSSIGPPSRLVEPTGSRNITVGCRRSASSHWVGRSGTFTEAEILPRGQVFDVKSGERPYQCRFSRTSVRTRTCRAL